MIFLRKYFSRSYSCLNQAILWVGKKSCQEVKISPFLGYNLCCLTNHWTNFFFFGLEIEDFSLIFYKNVFYPRASRGFFDC